MPKRGNDTRIQTRGFAAVAVLGRWALRRFARHPLDSFAILCAAGISLVIVINAAILQTGTRAAPFFTIAPPPAPVDVRAAPAAPITAKAAADPNPTNSVTPLQAHQVVPVPVPSPLRRDDPIADLLGPSPRLLAVQRVLADYGYGQIRPSGTMDTATSTAIAKFEREHKLPASGRLSERLLTALAAMAGHPIE